MGLAASCALPLLNASAGAQELISIIDAKDVQLRLVNYSGAMKLFAYANSVEFIAINLDGTAIPQAPFQTNAVEAYAYDASKVHHIADGFLGNDIVHGGGKRLDDGINQAAAGWWQSIKDRLLNPKQANFSVHPGNLIKGKNKFDASIAQLTGLPLGSRRIYRLQCYERVRLLKTQNRNTIT